MISDEQLEEWERTYVAPNGRLKRSPFGHGRSVATSMTTATTADGTTPWPLFVALFLLPR